MQKGYFVDVGIDFYIILNHIVMGVNVADIILVNLQVHISDRQEHRSKISYIFFIYLYYESLHIKLDFIYHVIYQQ